MRVVLSNRCPAIRGATLLLALSLWAVAAHSETTSPADSDTTNPVLNWNELLTDPDPVQLTDLASRYEQAIGYRRDYGRAIQLYCAAARLGYPPAQRRLARMYAYALGTYRDRGLAVAWLEVAAAAGDLKAVKFLNVLGEPRVRKQPRCEYESRPLAPAFKTSPEPKPATNSTTDTATAIETATEIATETATETETSEQSQNVSWVHQLAPHYGLDPNLILAIIQTPPNFTSESRPVTPVPGLMQFNSSTAYVIGIKDATDPLQNLNGGMAYISWLLSSFEGDLRLSLASYHAGEDAVEKYGGVPPFPETQGYIDKVLRAYGRDTHPLIDPAVEP